MSSLHSTTSTPLVIMGIDPGTNVLGYGILKVENSQSTIEAMGVIDLRKCTDVYLKLGRIHDNIILDGESLNNFCNMLATCCLLANPFPVIESLILVGLYSCTTRSRSMAAAIATPWARPNFIAL